MNFFMLFLSQYKKFEIIKNKCKKSKLNYKNIGTFLSNKPCVPLILLWKTQIFGNSKTTYSRLKPLLLKTFTYNSCTIINCTK